MAKGYINACMKDTDATAFIVDFGEFIKIGSNEEILSMLTQEDEIIDLNGSFVSSGFIDSHMHLLEIGHYLRNVQLDHCKSITQVQESLKLAVVGKSKNDWVIARGFNEENFDEPIMITKQMLDDVSSIIPICVTRADGHLMVVNSAALNLAGIMMDSTFEGGTIDFEQGILTELAIQLIHDCWPLPDIDSIKEDILAGAKYANQFGITAVGSDDFLSVTKDWGLVLDAFMSLAYQGKLTVRVNEQCEFESAEKFASFLDEGYTSGVGDDFFRIGPLKMILDGSLGARTAALTTPYADNPDTKGQLIYTNSELKAWLELASSYNMPTICHAIGDAAVDQALSQFEKVVLEGNPLHHGLVHCQILRKAQIEKILQMQLDCYIQSIFIDVDANMLEERVGSRKAQTCYPFKTLYEGTLCANGTDAPVQQPDVLLGLQMAVTRQNSETKKEMNQNETLTIAQALDSFTNRAATITGFDDITGQILEGYKADFVVLENNPLSQDVNQLIDNKVLMTVVNGDVVYER